MAIQTIKGGMTIPSLTDDNITLSFNGKLLDASGEKFAAIFKIPKTGTVAKIGFRTGTVTTSETLKIGLETISGGNPTGTAYGGMVAGTQAAPASDTFYTVALGTDASVTAGDSVAVVIEFNSTVGDLEIDSISSGGRGHPYIAHFTASWVRDDNLPIISIEYDDGSYEFTGMFPVEDVFGLTFNSGSTPDEHALRFSLPFDCRVSGFWMPIDTNLAAFDVVLYEGTTQKALTSYSTSEFSTNVNELLVGLFSAGVDITANTEYFLAVKPGASSVSMASFSVASVAIMDSLSGGQDFYYASRVDAGAWTTDTTKRFHLGLYIDQFDDGVGGGGGLITHPGMSGGMRG